MTPRQLERALSTTRFTTEPYYPTIADCRRWTAILNFVMFGGRLPSYRKITVRRLRGIHAYCEAGTDRRGKRYCHLTVHRRFNSFAAFYSVLAHELCHAAEHFELGQMNHGRYFYSHRELLASMGVKLYRSY